MAIAGVASRGRLLVLLASLLLLALLSARARAEAPAQAPRALKKLSLEELFDLEVTSVSQRPESLSKVAAAVHVVTQDDLRRRGATSIPEALRDIPGVEVAQVDSRNYAITARGSNGTVANKLLVLIDGRSVYTPLFSGVFWDVQDVFLEDVEQIEVIRGPGATVWGANAVNGVINIITQDAQHTQGWIVTGGGGSYETGFGGARYGAALGPNAFLRVYGKHFNRDATQRPNGDEAGDSWWMSQGGARVDWSASEADHLTLQGDGYGGREHQAGPDAVDLAGGNALAHWTRRYSDVSDLQVSFYYDRTDRESPPIFHEILDTYDAELRHHFAPWRGHDVVWGLGYRRTHDAVANSPGFAFLPQYLTQDLFSGFVQDELALASDVRFTLGTKIEHNDYTGVEIEPSARLAWTPRPTRTIWGAVSRAVRTPSRLDRDLFLPATPPFQLAGGPGFDSEVLYSIELGAKLQPAPSLTASISTFYNLYDDLRSLEMGPPAFLANGLEGRAVGVETEAGWQATPSCRLTAGYTYLDLDFDAEEGSTDVSQAAQKGDSPRHQAHLRSALNLPHGMTLDAGARYVGELSHQRVPDYLTADVRWGWQVLPELEIAVVGRNLVEPRHAEFGLPATRREVPRSVYGKLTCRF